MALPRILPFQSTVVRLLFSRGAEKFRLISNYDRQRRTTTRLKLRQSGTSVLTLTLFTNNIRQQTSTPCNIHETIADECSVNDVKVQRTQEYFSRLN